VQIIVDAAPERPVPPGIPEALIQRRLMVWTGLFGVISYELNGQRPQVTGGTRDRDAFFAGCVRRRISFIGISWSGTRPPHGVRRNAPDIS
jgi:hypothetical protein